MHELIRRAYEEMCVYSNHYAAIRIITAGLQSSENDSESSGSQRQSTRRLTPYQTGAVIGSRNHNNDTVTGNTSAGGSFAETTALSRGTILSVSEGGKAARLSPYLWGAINRTQRLRMLLLRADAYSVLKQHDKALEDALEAAQISYERSPEAYFVMGREYLRLFRLGSAVNAFDKAEELLLSVPLLHGNSCVEEITDENFWAQRGYHMKDVERLKLNRHAMEREEQRAYSVMFEEDGNNGSMTAAPASQRALVTSMSAEGANTVIPQLAHWKQLAKEARALHTMSTSHVLPIGFLQTALQFLEHQMNFVRCGAVACIENTTSRNFRMTGCASPDAVFRNGMQFPDTIPPGHCGVALLQPRGRWGGFVCSVCYEMADSGVGCFFCFETSLMGLNRCGVRFASEQRSLEFGCGLKAPNSKASGTSSMGTPTRDLVGFKIPNPSLWLPTQVAPLPSGRKLKLSGATRSSSRVMMFTATEILSVRLRSVELLTALEFAGPNVLKKMSAVNRRYRELINNLPPPMFFGAGRCSYPDYCLSSDRLSSPWIVHDKEPVKWNCLFDGRLLNRELFQVTDATDPHKTILYFLGESSGSVETMVFYGDRRTLIAQIKGSWVPFSSTLYLCTSSGRTFASCFLNRNSELTLAWDGANKKNKEEDVEYVMHRIDSARRRSIMARMNTVLNLSTVNGIAGTEASDAALISSTSEVADAATSVPTGKINRGFSLETYAVWRSQRTSVGSLGSGVSRQTNNGMELVGEVTINVPSTQTTTKGSVVAEILLCAGADALLVTLMAYCRSQWDS
ncbi:putative pumilio-repeat, RNA-binding protein [Trypanosoma rangeli]|uniref:Putative pumilio-repeat, RNA-binding protein n=1 Tax=Trypanosoma rangeli TaxID=5698 RepID=A0A3R7MI74_TRYRA|nr:putative pumilio-repeat, RNA-binding protein [Trypanosoma rangeli]RNF02960.1 putative pumilio-repeat, RNA-binding protein [Trypanosoma rangeli]|eukprot:RNF02960.1 putative pumilio-repeat, RNA-binding protein [Trypanosoma rangeli]